MKDESAPESGTRPRQGAALESVAGSGLIIALVANLVVTVVLVALNFKGLGKLDAYHGKLEAEIAAAQERLERVRLQAAEWQSKGAAYQQAGIKAAQDLEFAHRLLTDTRAEESSLSTQLAESKRELERVRIETAGAQTNLETTRASLQKPESDLVVARKRVRELSASQTELTGEVSRLEALVQRLQTERKQLEQARDRYEQ
jgi:chromosome segregation ATPase